MKRLLVDVLLFPLGSYANRESITYDFDNAFKYVGKLKNGKLHGHGTITLPDCSKYVGQFRGTKEHGYGELTRALYTLVLGLK